MFRRSVRLQDACYYTEQGSPSVSYKERPYKVFRRRTCHDPSAQRGTVSNNYEPRDHGDFITPDYHHLDNQEDADNQASLTTTRNNTDTSAPTLTAQIRTPHSSTAEAQAAHTTTTRTQAPRTIGTQTLTSSETQTTLMWTGTATTGTQTVRPKRKIVKTTCSFSFHFGFPLLFLLALGLIHMQLQMAEFKQEVQSLRRRLNTISPPADNIPNFALKSQGASVTASLSSETYWPYKIGMILNSVFHWLYTTKRQTGVIQGRSSLHPGECWPFSGDRGHLFVTLSHPVEITHVTLGHITKSQSPNGFIASAPREFSIYGLTTTDEEGTFLGKLVYDQEGAAFQTFQVTNPDKGVFRHVKLQIENNWGNTDNTCLYSFRVHGNLPTQQLRPHLK